MVRLPLIVIVGPTAVGKTEAALNLAERLQGEIVSADSRLFYRGMDVGTAKPTLVERERVRHHLIDMAGPDETWSLAEFQRAARAAIADIHARGRLPFLVGGTGQYVRAVTQGWSVPERAPEPRLRHILEKWVEEIGHEGLHARLNVLDPAAASLIDSRNVRRTIRALEVIFLTGRRFSEQRRKNESPYRILPLGITRPRSELYARIDARIQTMLEAGWVAEVQALLNNGYSCTLPSMSAIGYGEMCAYLRGRTTLEEAVRLIQRHTRIFVRRQAAWFRLDDPQMHWFEVGEDMLGEMEKAIREFLGE
jgi:tRNA dimethylallyltransferase